jgi:hypothetical protein
MRRFGYQNAVLTAIAVVLTLGLIDRRSGGEFTSLPQVHAQPDPDQGGMTNALEQRKIMIAELRSMSAKLDRLEAKLAAGVAVKVTSMPPPEKPKAEQPKPEPKNGNAAPRPNPSK